MALTNIGFQKTPGRPVDIKFDADTNLPSDLQELLLIGHAATGATGTNTIVVINNAGDVTAGTAEANTKFGAGSELAKMVIAAITANIGQPTSPTIKCAVLANSDTGIASAAQTAILAVKAEFLVSPYDLHTDSANKAILLSLAQTMSGAQRVENNQYGTVGWGFNRSVTDPSVLTKFDTQYLLGVWLRDTGSASTAPAYSIGEMAAASAAMAAGPGIPFNPLDDLTIGGVAAPLKSSDWPTVGAALESETALGRGWTPLYVKPNGEVAFVRSVTSRLTVDADGVTTVSSYYDLQDFQVLYLWRKTLKTRFSQADFKRRKASSDTAQFILAEGLRLAKAFEDQGMFQAVSKLAKQFQVQRNASDRSRFDFYTPVNVIPGLHTIASEVSAGTQFDLLTI